MDNADSASKLRAALLIEDDEVDRRSILRSISKHSIPYQFDSARSLAEAKDLLANKHYDVIVTDFNLPDSSGLDTITALQNTPEKVPIIVLSGLNDEKLALEAVHRGAQDFIPKDYINDIGLITRTLHHAIERHQLRRNLEDTRDRERFLAHYDQCTTLPNRLLFLDRLNQTVIQSQRRQVKFALCFLDLDRFKEVNDSLGHFVGDEVLCTVSKRMKNVLRESDTVARYGGDEFTLILHNTSGEENIYKIAKKIIASVNRPIVIGEHTCSVGVSIGVAFYPRHGHSPEVLIKHADMAMYDAKARGRNQLKIFSHNLFEQKRDFFSRERALREALRNPDKHFSLHYQPKVDLQDGTIRSVEALIRWNHPTIGNITPDQFIPLSEELGVIGEIDEWVLDTACKQSLRWQQANVDIRIAINISSRSLNRTDFANAFVAPKLQKYGIDGKNIEIEITESMLLDDTKQVHDQLVLLKSLNVAIAIDDFGTGFSSLSYLNQFPIDTLKIDGSFVCDSSAKHSEQALLKAIIALGDALGLNVVAECVETEAQMQFLQNLHCNEGQGYYWGKPSADWKPKKD